VDEAGASALETVFMLCVATIPITPYGTRLAMYPFTVASSLPVSVASVLEWQVMPFNLAAGNIPGAHISFFLDANGFSFFVVPL